MSRLIIKNLPSYVTNEKLKAHFLQKEGPGGTITDVNVAQKRADGSSRRFAFVGYKSEEEAEKARSWFDRTFIGSTKICVLLAEVSWGFLFFFFPFFLSFCDAKTKEGFLFL
jgi:multiple RNA-binding domain-containing protein 1